MPSQAPCAQAPANNATFLGTSGAGFSIRLTRHYNFLQSIQPLTIDKFKRDFPDLEFVPMLTLDGSTSSVIFPGITLQPRDAEEAGKEVSLQQRQNEEASWLEQGGKSGAAPFLASTSCQLCPSPRRPPLARKPALTP